MSLRPVQLKIRLAWIEEVYKPGEMDRTKRDRLRQLRRRAKIRLVEMETMALLFPDGQPQHKCDDWKEVLDGNDNVIGWRCDCGKIRPAAKCKHCKMTFWRVTRRRVYCTETCCRKAWRARRKTEAESQP